MCGIDIGTLLLISLCVRSGEVLGAQKYSVCQAGKLRVTQTFEATRVAATIFPCLVTNVMLKYQPPAVKLVSFYRPLCFSLRICYAVTPRNQVTNAKEFDMVVTCYIKYWQTIAKMGAFHYLDPSQPAGNQVNESKFMHALLTDNFKCFDDVEGGMRFGADTSIAILRWIMNKFL